MNNAQQDLEARLPEYGEDAISYLSDLDLSILLTHVSGEMSARMIAAGGGEGRTRTVARPYVIVSREGARVLDPANFTDVARFGTRQEARAYMEAILPEIPSSDLPLSVMTWTE